MKNIEIRTIKDLEEFIKEYGYNPLVTTENNLNSVNIKTSYELNKELIEYLNRLYKTNGEK